MATEIKRISPKQGLALLLKSPDCEEKVDEGANPSWLDLGVHPFPTQVPLITRSVQLADVLASDAKNVEMLCSRIRKAICDSRELTLQALRKAEIGARTYYEVVIGEDSLICSVDNEAELEMYQLECVFEMLSALFGVDFVDLVFAEEPAASFLKSEVPTMVH